MLVSVVLMGLAVFVVYKFKRYSMSGARRGSRYAPWCVCVCVCVYPTTLLRRDAIVSSSWAAWTVRRWSNCIPELQMRQSPLHLYLQNITQNDNPINPPPELTGWHSLVVINIHPSDNVIGWPFGNAKHSRSRWGVLWGMAAKVEEISPETTYIIQEGAYRKQPTPWRLIPRQSSRPSVVLAVIRSFFAP